MTRHGRSDHSNTPSNPDPSGDTGTSPTVDLARTWATALRELERRISKSAFDNWFKDTAIARIENDEVWVTGPNVFSVQTIQNRYGPQIEQALERTLGMAVTTRFSVNGEQLAGSAPPRLRPAQGDTRANRRQDAGPSAIPMRQSRLESGSRGGLHARLTFDNYVVGSSNKMAHAAAMAVADNPGHSFNPLFVYGGVGLGKTHLLHAIGHRALAANPDLTILYVTSETFTNEVINAIRTQKMDDFRGRYRSIDILMIDDIQFIAGKESTQEEFFHTFNALYQNGKHIVITSDKPPGAIAALEERMRSRFLGGLPVDVQLPDYEMRTAILRAKAEDMNVIVPDDVVQYIANKDQSNIREIEGALNKILMFAQLYRRPVTLQLAMESLTDASIANRRANVTMREVIEAVKAQYNVSDKDLSGRDRRREIVVPRQVAMYLLREETSAALKDIGRALGDRDHTTVMHGIEKVEHALETDAAMRTQVMAIREALIGANRT